MSLGERKTRASFDRLHAKFDKLSEQVAKRHQRRFVLQQRDVVDEILDLESCLFVQLHEHPFRVVPTLDFDDDAHAVAIALVSNVADAVERSPVDVFGDLFHQTRLVRLVRNLADDDGVLGRTVGRLHALDIRPSSQGDGALTRSVNILHPALVDDDAAGGKIRRRHERDELLQRAVGILRERAHRVQGFTEIMRRHVRRHRHRDPARTVNE